MEECGFAHGQQCRYAPVGSKVPRSVRAAQSRIERWRSTRLDSGVVATIRSSRPRHRRARALSPVARASSSCARTRPRRPRHGLGGRCRSRAHVHARATVVRLLNGHGREPNLRSQRSRSGFASTTLRLRVIRLEPGRWRPSCFPTETVRTGRDWKRVPVVRHLVLALRAQGRGRDAVPALLRLHASPFAPRLLATRRQARTARSASGEGRHASTRGDLLTQRRPRRARGPAPVHRRRDFARYISAASGESSDFQFVSKPDRSRCLSVSLVFGIGRFTGF